jgi:hypothetical protein
MRFHKPGNFSDPYSNELIRGTTDLVQHFRLQGEFHIGARALLDINFIWFGHIARLSRWGGGGILLVQIITTCLRFALRN